MNTVALLLAAAAGGAGTLLVRKFGVEPYRRQRILAVVRATPGMTPSQIARRSGIWVTQAVARRHLAELEALEQVTGEGGLTQSRHWETGAPVKLRMPLDPTTGRKYSPVVAQAA